MDLNFSNLTVALQSSRTISESVLHMSCLDKFLFTATGQLVTSFAKTLGYTRSFSIVYSFLTVYKKSLCVCSLRQDLEDLWIFFLDFTDPSNPIFTGTAGISAPCGSTINITSPLSVYHLSLFFIPTLFLNIPHP